MLTEVAQFVMEFWTSFAVGGFAGERARGFAILAVGVAVTLVDVIRLVTFTFAAREVPANSNVIMVMGCMVGECDAAEAPEMRDKTQTECITERVFQQPGLIVYIYRLFKE